MSATKSPAQDESGARSAARTARALSYAAGALAVAVILALSIGGRALTLIAYGLCVAVLALVLAGPLVGFGRAVRALVLPPAQAIYRRLRDLLAPVLRALLAPLRRLDRRFESPVERAVRDLRTRPASDLRVLRWLTWLGIVVVTLVALALAVLVVTAILGSLLGGRTTPIAVDWLYAGAAVTATVLVLMIAFLAWALGVVVFRRHWRAGTVALPGIMLVLGVGLLLSSQPDPGEVSYADKQGRRSSGSLHDILVVLDPADRAGAALATFAGENLWTASRPRRDTVPYDVAFAVVVPTDAATPDRSDAWAFVEPPTTIRRHFLESIARVVPTPSAPATGAYSALLSGLRASVDFDWRDGARRTVALVLAELPGESALDRRDVPRPEGVPSWRALVEMGDADRTADVQPDRYTRLVVLTEEQRPERLELWRGYVERIGGRVLAVDAIDAAALRDVEDAATGAPPSDLRALAQRFSPRLRFDSDEQFFPVDVDQLLRRRGPDGGHRVCRHLRLEDSCEPIDSYRDLLDPYDEYIDFEGGARLGKDLVDRDNRLHLPRRIYVQAVEDEQRGRLHLAYWWFMRYNVSPVAPERNCLPGFTVAETTCFDHEGDWEGITVTLAADGDDPRAPYAPEHWRPESASFASHSAITRWDWDMLDVDDTHPFVYVALGSHAAYPARCTDRTCDQRLAGIGLPEGRFDGRLDWSHDATACCLPLPVTPEGKGALWNAFRGRWGKAACTVVVKVCSQSDGPWSPSRQRRSSAPEGRTFSGQAKVLAEYRERYGP